MKKQISLVLAMCKLHNFIINNSNSAEDDMNVPEQSPRDILYSVHHGGGINWSEDGRPLSLIIDTVDGSDQRNIPQGADVI